MAHPEARSVDPRQFHVGFLRAGDTLMDHSRISTESETQRGLKSATEILEKGTLMVFDAHRTWMDIGFSAARLTEELPIQRYLIPFAAYLKDRRVYGSLLSHIKAQVKGVELMPVVREEDRIDYEGNLGVRPRGVGFTKKQVYALNIPFLKRAKELIEEDKPRSAILLAPYGSRRTYRKWFRDGALGLARKGVPILVTLSARERVVRLDNAGANLDHTTFVSPEILRFDRNNSDKYIDKMVDAQFAELERRAGIS